MLHGVAKKIVKKREINTYKETPGADIQERQYTAKKERPQKKPNHLELD